MHAAYIKCELILIEILHGIFVLLKIHVRLLELVNQKCDIKWSPFDMLQHLSYIFCFIHLYNLQLKILMLK